MANDTHHQFLKLFLMEEPLLRTYLLSATGNADATDDLLQSTAAVLLDKWTDYDPERPFRPWALAFAHLEVLKWRQRLARTKEILCEDAARLLAETAVEIGDDLDRRQQFLVECLEALPAPQHETLRLRYGLGLKIADMAKRNGTSLAAMEMVLSRLRKVLRECIGRKAAAEEAGGL
jgi:RNA polymerase sigma-70 factor (ECF subfamily)